MQQGVVTKLRGLLIAAPLVAAGCVVDMGSPGTGTGEQRVALGPLGYAVDVSVWSGPLTDAEMDCFWDDGVRHVIVGTQSHRVARQQLEMALARGMSVDGYVYLYWDRDMRRQVEDALGVLAAYPIGRLWLDVEEDPEGRSRRALMDRVRLALDACGEVPCGIYTGRWWWQPNGTNEFGDVPLWYSHYDGDPDLGTWAEQRFGGWEAPYGKQWMGDIFLCGIDVDQNTIHVDAEPVAEHPAPEPEPPGLPREPRDLYPDGETVEPWHDARLLWGAVPGATGYEVAIEVYSAGAWRPYFTYRPAVNARWFSPIVHDAAYRFRVRAVNASGLGPWSYDARFDFGTVRTPPPDAETETETERETEPEPETEPEDSGAGVPSGLGPDGERITRPSVTLTWEPVEGADLYEVEIELYSAGSWRAYYTYAVTAARRIFWPSVRETAYRFRARARVGGVWSPWSSFATFDFA